MITWQINDPASSSTFNNSFINNKSNSILTKHISEEYWGDIDSFCNKYGFYHHQQQQTLFGPIPRFQEAQDQCSEPSILQDSSKPLETYIPRSIKEDDEFKKIDTSDEVGQKLSTQEILKLAGERFLHFSSHKFINISTLHPHATSLSTLSPSDKQDVELAQLLLAAADKVGNHELDRATILIINCQWISSNAGTPVQRAVYYFAEALMERINKEKSSSNEQQGVKNYDACLKKNILALVSLYQQIPLFQIVHFTAAQTILENIGKSSKKAVHLIDFQILTGLHWAAVIQAMSEQSRDQNSHLRITTVKATDKSGAEKAGNLLRSFAAHLKLPFSYNLVFCSDMKDLRQEDFNIEPEETVAVMFNFLLRTLISKPVCLKNLMNITQKINPTITVVSEVEANHNSPSFVNRFIEALFYYGVLFDGLAESMACDGESRIAIKSATFREGIRNIVASEG
ncbi:hypothetical protein C2S53_013586 [Perilla frutescens var. hirtella]|uniref:Uncharacterized protein n=1 Tax=Perilla frutescens var. hirtella TaxID=608512 RepID=A0AAD4IZA5_PERFH|nr:hypothetical protein C2S53_013586 [Perilla frutescens var. hirtella]